MHISHRCGKKQKLNSKVKGLWAYVIHKICRNLELFVIISFFFSLSCFHIFLIACSHDKDGRQMAGSHGGYGLRRRKKSCGLKLLGFASVSILAFFCYYLHEIGVVNYQVTVPTKS